MPIGIVAGPTAVVKKIRCLPPFDTNEHIAKLKFMNGQFILQSLLVEGVIDGKAFNNSSESEVKA